jgi:recombinational DNA repair ATPase RecF
MLLRQVKLENLLSFRDTTVELRALNVLIGANASGKSNLIEAIGLLQAAPVDLNTAILRLGGVHVVCYCDAIARCCHRMLRIIGRTSAIQAAICRAGRRLLHLEGTPLHLSERLFSKYGWFCGLPGRSERDPFNPIRL